MTADCIECFVESFNKYNTRTLITGIILISYFCWWAEDSHKNCKI